MKQIKFYVLLFILNAIHSLSYVTGYGIFAPSPTDSIARSLTLENGIFQADPTIFYDNGYYYLYGTNGNGDKQLGFKVYRSQD